MLSPVNAGLDRALWLSPILRADVRSFERSGCVRRVRKRYGSGKFDRPRVTSSETSDCGGSRSILAGAHASGA